MVVAFLAFYAIRNDPRGLLFSSALMGVLLARAWWLRLADHGAGRMQVRLSPEGIVRIHRGSGPLPFDCRRLPRPVPWTAIGNIDLQTVDPEHVLVRVHAPRKAVGAPWWKPYEGALQVEVTCTAAERQLILSRIAGWRLASRERQASFRPSEADSQP